VIENEMMKNDIQRLNEELRNEIEKRRNFESKY
jgi:hypothetical protein